jgi:hypothetical protein
MEARSAELDVKCRIFSILLKMPNFLDIAGNAGKTTSAIAGFADAIAALGAVNGFTENGHTAVIRSVVWSYEEDKKD